MKKLPAYAKPIMEARRAGFVPAQREVAVLLDHWGAFLHLERVVVPPLEALENFEWSFLYALGVFVVWNSAISERERAVELARRILLVSPDYLLMIDRNADANVCTTWIKSKARGLEVKI